MPVHHFLSSDNPLTAEFIAKAFDGFEAVSVPSVGTMQSGQCYENVRSTIRQFGGTPKLGFLLTYIPDLLVEAIHHAVWQKPDGGLADVTAAPYPGMANVAENQMVLLPEASLAAVDPKVPPIFSELSPHPYVKQYIAATTRKVLAQRSYFDILHRLNIPTLNGTPQIAGEVPLPLLVMHQRLLEAMQAHSLAYQRIRSL